MGNPPPLGNPFQLVIPMLWVCAVILLGFGAYLLATGAGPQLGGALMVAGVLDAGLAVFLSRRGN